MGYHKPKRKFIIPLRVAERAATRFKIDEDGCWISTYSVASHGYAQIGWQDRKADFKQVVTAHRAAWVYRHGQIPEGMTIDHTCKTRPCVNPDHLRMMSNYENARRVFGKDWKEGECVNGHQNFNLVDDPFRRTKRGEKRIGKRCKICVQLYQDRKHYKQANPNSPYPPELLLASEIAELEGNKKAPSI